jgi:hypothetical protein
MERLYVGACAEFLGLPWTIQSEGEAPDFVISDEAGLFGLEVTNAFTGEMADGGSVMRRQEGVTRKLLSRMSRKYKQLSGVDVHVRFSGRPI